LILACTIYVFNFSRSKRTLQRSLSLILSSFHLAENNRVPLQYVYGVENSDYINAVFVNVRITDSFNYLAKVESEYGAVNSFPRMNQYGITNSTKFL
jgi:hypothetical protein